MPTIVFEVLGEPKGKDRPRLTTINGHARAYTTKKTINYENRILMSYRLVVKDSEYENKVPFDKDKFVKINIDVYFSLNKQDYCKKGLSKSGREKISGIYCTKHKDLDNIVKSVLDALNGVAYDDDKQVVIINARKLYTENMSRVEVKLTDDIISLND